MVEWPSKTESLCPHCLRRIPAFRIVEDGSVYMKKNCSDCGDPGKVPIWKNTPVAYDAWRRGTATDLAAEINEDCPFACGICSNHRQETCTAIIEVTGRCNLTCPVCFADSQNTPGPDPGRAQIVRMLEAVLDRGGPCPIQLSGGEPTLRNDLPRIVETARTKGFDHVQINTNGMRLAQDEEYGQALADAGVTTVFLQFDGVSDDVYRRIRGTDLLNFKLKAVERCAELKMGVVLVPTVIKRVNDAQIGAIVRFAKKWIPFVKGVHFQPVTYSGRFLNLPKNDSRILIPDLLLALEQQTGELKVADMVPPG